MHLKNNSVWIGGLAALALAVALAAYFNPNRTSPVKAAATNATPGVSVPDRPRIVTLPPGTRISVRLDQTVSSKSAPGTEFPATVSEPIVVNGETVIPTGARATGLVVDANRSGRLKGAAHLTLALDSVDAGGAAHQLETNTYALTGRKHKKRNLIAIGGGAGSGALIGGLAAGPVGALIGSGAGAGAGTTFAAVTGKKEVRVVAETRITFALRQPVEVAIR